MTSTTIGVGHGMGSIALAVHQHSARLGAGSLFQAFGVLEVPVVAADSGHRNENFAVAAIIGAVHPTLASVSQEGSLTISPRPVYSWTWTLAMLSVLVLLQTVQV